MRLSKQERIAAIVVIVLVVLVAGVFLFIKPNIETIIATKATLEAKEKEYNDDVAKAATKGQLRTDILASYDKGKNLADMFFPELSAYEADNEFRAFLETCEANVLVEDLSVSAPKTIGLSTSVFIPSEVQYALKEYVNQGGSDPLTTDPRLVRQALIQVALGEAQTIGATTVSFTLWASTPEDILKFADEVNRYQKSENGKTIRKSIELAGINFTNIKLVDDYTALAESILNEAEAAAADIFKQETGFDVRGFTSKANNNTTVTQTPAEGAEGEEGGATATVVTNPSQTDDVIEHYMYGVPCTVTFYSIVRMQDPTPTLDEQDAAA